MSLQDIEERVEVQVRSESTLEKQWRIEGQLRFELSESRGAAYVKAYRGKALKPYRFYRFRSVESRAAWIEAQVESQKKHEEFKAEMAAKRVLEKRRHLELLVPGTILTNSWGYDQTNVDFYEIVRRSGVVCWVRAIGQDCQETGFMSGKCRPKPGSYVGPEVKKTITSNGIQFKHGWTSPTEPDKEHFCSWYA